MGQSNLSDAFPDYLAPLFNIPFSPYFIIGLFLGIIAFIFYIKYLGIKKSLKEKYVFLEVKPTDRTLKSPLSTNQLFTVLHSLEKDSSDWLIKSKRSISFELVSTKEEGIRFVLRVPYSDTSVIKKNLLAYLPGIEVKEIEDYTPSDKKIQIKELQLKRPFVFPLEEQSTLNQYDPIAYVTAHMTKLDDNELVALQFITTPIHENTHSRILSYTNKLKDMILENKDISDEISSSSPTSNLVTFAMNLILFVIFTPFTAITWLLTNDKGSVFPTWVFEKSKKKTINEVGFQKQQFYQSIQNKISQPLLEVTIRAFALTNRPEEGRIRLKGILSSFDTFSSPYQALKAKHSLVPFPQWLKDFQLEHRASFFSTNPILSVSELSSMYHLPYTLTTKTEDILQVKSPQLPPPLSFKQKKTHLDIAFAQNKYGQTVTMVGQTLEERRRHTYIIGATGTGKSTLLLHMIYQDISNGNGIGVIDPHGQLKDKLLGIIPKRRHKDVVHFNPFDIEYPIGLNLLELPKNLSAVELQREKDFICSNLISVLQKLYEARYSGPRMEHVLRNVILTALEMENPTLFTIYELLTDSKYRKEVTDRLEDQVLKKFWKNEFEKFGSFQKAEMISPITNKLGRFLTTPLTRNILNQKESKLDFDDIMNNKKILICDLSKGNIGADNSYFLGSLIIAKIQLTSLRRIRTPEEQRKDFFLYIDEFQNFATNSFAEVLSEARKYRLGAILAHQNTVQIDRELLETIIGNSGTIISFRTTSPQDEDRLLPMFAPEVEKGQIMNLPSYTFYIKINALQPQDAFTGEIEDFPLKSDKATTKEVIELSRNKYATKIDISKLKVGLKAPGKPQKRGSKNKQNIVDREE